MGAGGRITQTPKLNSYLLQFLCRMTSGVKYLHLFFVQKLQHLWIEITWAIEQILICSQTKYLNSKIEDLIEIKQRANILKKIYALENASNGVLFSTVAGMRAYSFIKM